MYTTVVELADRYRFSRDAIYAWVRTNLIPTHCVVRIGNSIRIDSGEFDRLMRDGKLYRPRGRQAEERAQRSREAASGSAAPQPAGGESSVDSVKGEDQ